MGIADRLSALTKKAKDTAAQHSDQAEQTIQKAAAAADQRTGGKHHDKISKAQAKAEGYVENLQPSEPDPPKQSADTDPRTPGERAG